MEGYHGRVGVLCVVKPSRKSNRGPEIARISIRHRCLGMRGRRGDDVCGAWLVLDGEIEAQQLADPVMLRDRGKMLVQLEL